MNIYIKKAPQQGNILNDFNTNESEFMQRLYPLQYNVLYTLNKIIILEMNFVHKMIVVYFKIFLCGMFITLGQFTHSIIIHLYTNSIQKWYLVPM